MLSVNLVLKSSKEFSKVVLIFVFPSIRVDAPVALDSYQYLVVSAFGFGHSKMCSSEHCFIIIKSVVQL